jgi:hypothetical protein
LLTGSTPLEKARLRQAAYGEIIRRIREEDPPKPSTRLSESRESLALISAQRQTEPSRLPKLVRGELDWIVMKALEKDRSRRYETANGLARDIERHLGGDSVQAGPASRIYKLIKHARRHRAATVIAGAFLALFLVAASLIAMRAAQAAQQARLAEAEAARALFEARRAEKAEKLKRALDDSNKKSRARFKGGTNAAPTTATP